MLSFCHNLIILIALFLIASCSHKPAQIIDRGDFFYNKANSYKYSKNYQDNSEIEDGYIKVVAGDTLYGIASFYGIPAQDIINENNLQPPYSLRIGEKLKVPNNYYHRVQAGDTLFKISKLYNVKLETLAKNNNLPKPYLIQPGQVLVVSSKNIEIKNISKRKPKIATSKNPIVKDSVKPSVSNKKEPAIIANKKPSAISRIIKKDNEFSWPVKGKIVSSYGPKKGGLYNDGVNIKAKKGTQVSAAEDGIVAYVGNELRGYGNLIIIKHSDGWITAYAHLDKTFVGKGNEVKKGQKIAEVGATGNVSFDQLYFGLRKGRDAVNPQRYLK